MPNRNNILNLPGLTVQKIIGRDPLVMEVSYRRKATCPHCHSKNLRKKDTFIRRVWHELIGQRRTRLHIQAHKFHCRQCGRYFNQRFPGILKHQRATERLKEQLCRQHSQGVSQQHLSQQFKVGKATVERWYHRYHYLANQERLNAHCPKILGIDEHTLTKKKKGFVTTFCDLHRHRVFDVFKGRSNAELTPSLNRLQGKNNVKVVCIDLSASYKALAKQHFPNALIVADRFHVIRQLNHHCLKTYHHLDEKLKYQRGVLAALRTNPENLTARRRQLRDNYFAQHPAIEAIYRFKQRLHQLLMHKHCTAKKCRRLIPILLRRIHQLRSSPFLTLQTLGNTLFQWREEIARMWRFTKTNGITEGFHRKMKLIQRRAYGFKNFDNYRLRVRVLCS